jgi:hypothetical protein
MLGDQPLYSFFSDHLARILAENVDYEKDGSGNITELPCFGNAEEIALKLVQLLETLGWLYNVTYVLPESLDRLLPQGTDQYVLSGDSRLVRVTEEIRTEFPHASGRATGRNPFGGLLGALMMGPSELPLGRVLFPNPRGRIRRHIRRR